ncbi:hypothetical protein BSR55_04115 [Acinetobacter bereziniae]|jgi:DNA-binding CsgD family transcriptional regulator|nr:hypothetical protein BSR55_04115 [Acinetobacter bereziniae]
MKMNSAERNCLDAIIKLYLLETINYENILTLFKEYLQPVFKYESLIAGVGEIELTRVKIGEIISINYPIEFLEQIEKVTTIEKRSLLAYWLEKQEPIYVNSADMDKNLSDLEITEIKQFQLTPMLVHGQRDLSGKFSSYFSFRQCGIEENKAKYLIKVFMPYLHLILARGLQWEYNKNTDINIKLTSKEWELIDYIKNGMTNKEIAKNLNKSPSTIKNQILQLFRKLNVNNRSEVLSKIDVLSTSKLK